MCAAGMRLPISEMAEEFEKQQGIQIDLAYDGSNRLLGQIKLTHKGDVYIAGDADYVDIAKADGLVSSSNAVCRFIPVIMTRKGNPKGIKQLSDMTKPGMRIGQGDKKAAAVGRVMLRLLKLNGVDSNAWKKNLVLTTPTVNELALAVKLGTVDAVVIWDAVAAKYKADSDVVSIPPEKNICPTVGAAVLSSSHNKKVAEEFMKFMISERGRAILKKNGYSE